MNKEIKNDLRKLSYSTEEMAEFILVRRNNIRKNSVASSWMDDIRKIIKGTSVDDLQKTKRAALKKYVDYRRKQR